MKRLCIIGICLCLFVGCGGVPAAPSSSVAVTLTATTTATTAATTAVSVITATTETTAVATTAPSPTVRELLTTGHVADIYRTSYQSLFGRMQQNGFLQESLSGTYRGEYVRSIGALSVLAHTVGETEKAGRALRFVTDAMQDKNLSFVPFTISADGKTVKTADELDGRAQFVLGWALYIADSGDAAYFNETYALMKREADAFCSDAYFYADWNLVRNRRFTHTRVRNGNDYHDAFDLLTNTFTVAALRQLATVAAANGHGEDTALWTQTAEKLCDGIRKNLTRTVDGKTVYLELRDFDGGKGTAENGVSWVCFAPFAAGKNGVEDDILQNTVALCRSRLFKTAETGGYLAAEAAASGKVRDLILGKSVGWDIAAAVERKDDAHLLATLQFLKTYHTADLYMEKMQPSGNGYRTIDNGNAEQVIWFLWGMAQLRLSEGLSAKP